VTTANKLTYISVQEYLANEEGASLRHEYVDGRTFAMSGTTRKHNLIAGSIYSKLREHLRGKRCSAYMSDVKARVEATNSFYYPDVMVACDKFDKKSVFTAHPVLIGEVLSPKTAATDRREKAYAYKQIESLHEYLIVHQSRKRAELHRKNAHGNWDVFEFGPGTELTLESIPGGVFKLSMIEIYEDVDAHLGGLEVHEDAEADWNEEEHELDDEDGDLDW
jgi:Uma2 family endonuclease